jgi:hypothetical protein
MKSPMCVCFFTGLVEDVYVDLDLGGVFFFLNGKGSDIIIFLLCLGSHISLVSSISTWQ